MKIHILAPILAVVVIALVLVLRAGTTADLMQRLELAVGYGLAILVFLYGFVILMAMASGDIKIDTLLGESGGGASMSRFQLLIFTFVIALSLFFIVAKSGQFPQIPSEVLTLLGISATTYGVSKGIQAANPNMPPKTTGDGGPPPPPPPPPAGSATTTTTTASTTTTTVPAD